MIDHPEAIAPTTSEPFAVKTLYTVEDFDEIRADIQKSHVTFLNIP